MGYDGGVFLMGWMGGYVFLVLILVFYLRKFGKFMVLDFIGDWYYFNVVCMVVVICVFIVFFIYVAGQMWGVGLVFFCFFEVDINIGVYIGMVIVFFYVVFGGMKGIIYIQVVQYCVLIFVFMVLVIFIFMNMIGNFILQFGFIGIMIDGFNMALFDKLD